MVGIRDKGIVHSSESRAEAVARELLSIRGWKTTRPPKGNLLWKNEYRDFPKLVEAFAGRGKLGHRGDAYPDFILVESETLRPVLVGEAKAQDSEIATAIKEARDYSAGLIDRGVKVLAAGVAGDDSGEIAVEVDKWARTRWHPIEFRSHPIQWLPTPDEASNLLLDEDLFDLQPRVPPPEILAKRGDEINRILRECKINDPLRPAIMGAFMLALPQSKGNIRLDPAHILSDINEACRKAFVQAGKPELAESLIVPQENLKLASRAPHICYILRLLNITTLTAAHDYLGQLYEQFFRFTGGNTIGQFFTPRHITSFMTDLCNVGPPDMVVDPTCGTGGFLIAALQRMTEGKNYTTTELNSMVKKHLRGYEAEPITAALCVANMILRGDGKTGIVKGDCFTHPSYPEATATVVLGNPPFPHAKTDEPAEKFLNRGLDALAVRGKLCMIVPGSLLVKGNKRKWREKILRTNSLEAIITLPAELFQPYAASTTAIVILERGVSHSPLKRTFFARIENDGFRLKKNTRVAQPGSQIKPALENYHNHISIPGFCAWSVVKNAAEGTEWAPGAYIDATAHDTESLKREVDWLIRSLVAFHAQFAPELEEFLKYLKREETPIPQSYEVVSGRTPKSFEDASPSTIGYLFDVAYGQKELHNKENLTSGPALVVSSSGTNNGCYGFFDFDRLIAPQFVTVPSTGSIGESFIQLWPCGVTDDCLILTPKKGTDFEDLFIAAAVVRLERWRFNYGRKATPARIAYMKVDRDPALKRHIRASFDNAHVLMREIQNVLEPGRIDTSLEDQISKLSKQWRKETGHLSSIERKALHPAYQAIIATGKRGVPYVLRELKERGGHWFWALHYMTEVDLSSPGQTIDDLRKAWLEWGKKQGYAGL